MRVTEKGQVTIPKRIRERLGVHAGSEVDFICRDGRVFIERQTPSGPDEDPAAALLRQIDRHSGSFDFEGLQSDDVMRFLRD